jgi:hypothetical protein
MFNTFSPAAFKTLKSTVSWSFYNLMEIAEYYNSVRTAGVRDAAEYHYSARAESVKIFSTDICRIKI